MQTDTIIPGTYFNPGSKGESPVETGKFMMAIPAGSLVSLGVWELHMNRESASSWTRSVRLTFIYIAALYWGEVQRCSNLGVSSTPSPTNGRETHVGSTTPCQSCRLDSRFRFPSLAVLGLCKIVHWSAICTCGSDRHPHERRVSVPDTSSGRCCEKPSEEQKETLLKWATGVSLTPLSACVKLCRRT